jgi:hypothetical protein
MDSRDGQLPPYEQWQAISSDEIAQKMRDDTEFALDNPMDSPQRRAAIGLVLAVGNYEFAGDDPDEDLMKATTARLKELEEAERSKYWG